MLPIALFLPLLQEGAETLPATDGATQPNWIFPILAILGIFYFVLILPERKKQKQRQALLDSVKKGDKVMTTSGMHGTVAQLHDDVMVLQVADGVRLKFSRAALQTVHPVEGGAKGKKAGAEPDEVLGDESDAAKSGSAS